MILSPQLVPARVRETLGWPTGRGVRVGVVVGGYDNDLPDPRVAPGLGFVDPLVRELLQRFALPEPGPQHDA